MDQFRDVDDTRLMEDTSCAAGSGNSKPIGPDAEAMDTDIDTACRIERLSREAGIDPSSLTDVQIMEALYQMR